MATYVCLYNTIKAILSTIYINKIAYIMNHTYFIKKTICERNRSLRFVQRKMNLTYATHILRRHQLTVLS